jgi:tRNA(Ile)-lysidine synthase TilS/MesJ
VEQDHTALLEWADRMHVRLDIINTDIGDVVFNIRKEKNPCALCAKFRRGALNDAAKERGCNLIALGHNREDVLETFLLSLFYESRLNTFAPITFMDRAEVTVIRPLVFFPEKEAISAARRLELPVQKANCPVAGYTKREDMKDLLKQFRSIVPDPEMRLMKAIADTHKYGMWDRMKLPPDGRIGDPAAEREIQDTEE